MKNIALSVILIISILVIFSFGAMAMHRGNHSLCPFMSSMTICSMGIPEHLSYIQSIFNGTPQNTSLLISLLLLAVLAIALSIIDKNLHAVPKLEASLNQFITPTLFNKFLLALSDGIVQPKLYV